MALLEQETPVQAKSTSPDLRNLARKAKEAAQHAAYLTLILAIGLMGIARSSRKTTRHQAPPHPES